MNCAGTVLHVCRKNLLQMCACILFFLTVNSVAAEGVMNVSIPDTEKCSATQTYSPFELSVWPDVGFAVTGLSTSAITFYLQKKNDFPRWDGTLYDASTVNDFDRWAMKPYNKTLDYVATGTCAVDLAVLPISVFATEALVGNLPKGDWGTTAIMYAEAFLLSYGIKGLLKTSLLRVRPYMYFDGYPEDAIANSDFEFSCPSGHTTNAFLGAVFTSYVFAEYYPNSKWRIPVTCISLGIAAATGVLRVMSGNHFVSDVLAGAALGSFCGFIVPFVHHLISQKQNESVSDGTGVEQNKYSYTVTPLGIDFKLYL